MNRVEDLRGLLLDAFPERVCSGPITPVDNEWSEQLDDEQWLYEGLIGRHWRGVPALLCDLPDGYCLLTAEALAAYLPAWLNAALEDGPKAESIAEKLRALTARQREVLRAFVSEFGSTDPSEFVRHHAGIALLTIDGFIDSHRDAPERNS